MVKDPQNPSKYTVQAILAGQPFLLKVADGEFDYSNVGDQQPIICDGKSNLTLGLGQALTGADEGLNGGYIFLIIVCVVGIPGLAFYCWKKQKAKGTPGDGVTMQGTIPPAPPAAAGGSLPPGWVEHVDPASKHPYFINTATGESSWTRPVHSHQI